MKRILVVTDFTPLSTNAIHYALQFAKHLGARITLFHVYNHNAIEQAEIPEGFKDALINGNEEESLAYFQEYGHYIKSRMKLEVPMEYILQAGNPSKEIVAYAEFMAADLTVMGTWRVEGLSGAFDFMMGNVTTKVIQNTKIPVLVIPEKTDFKPLKHIGYATNLQEKEQRLPHELEFIFKSFESQLSCIHVRKPVKDSYVEALHFGLLKGLYELENSYANTKFYAISHPSVVQGLEIFVREHGVDMLVMQKNQSMTIFERLLDINYTKQMTFRTRLPLLILQA